MKKLFVVVVMLWLVVCSDVTGKNPTKQLTNGVELAKAVSKHNSIADFRRVKFDSIANFSFAKFESFADFRGAKFESFADFSFAEFKSTADFMGVKFDSTANFLDAKFESTADFWDAKFESTADFMHAKFDSNAKFTHAKFDSKVDFWDTKFESNADFWGAKFNSTSDFRGAVFKDTLNLIETKFKSGVDFRRSNFDSVTVIYLEGIDFNDGDFKVRWEQISAKDSIRIRILNPPDNKDEHYSRIEIIYKQLRDNYKAQDDKESADAVMAELAEYESQIYGWDKPCLFLCWFFLGYGYEIWRYLLFIFLPIIIAFSICFNKTKYFYHLIPSLFSKHSDSVGVEASLLESKKATINHLTTPLNRKIYSLYFSASVFFGIRWKKEWTRSNDNRFLYIILFEYVLGKGLIILLAVLAKGSYFDTIKGVLGF